MHAPLFLNYVAIVLKLVAAILDTQNVCQKLQALSKFKYLYTRRKLSVSSFDRLPLIVANFVDTEVTHI